MRLYPLKTRVLLVTLLALVITALTGSSLLAVRNHLRRQMVKLVSEDLRRSVETFESLHAQRIAALERQSALLANLPTLKALMTTSDEATIVNGARPFWKLSGADLFGLIDNDGQAVACFVTEDADQVQARNSLSSVGRNNHQGHYLHVGNMLYAYSSRPLYFGDDTHGTVLGRVVSGFAVDTNFVRQIGQISGAEAVFISGRQVFASTGETLTQLVQQSPDVPHLQPGEGQEIRLGDTLYLTRVAALSDSGVTLLVLKSLDPLEEQIHAIDRRLTIVGIIANLVGCMLMVVISYQITRPLETLTENMRAFGRGDSVAPSNPGGTAEVREMGQVFSAMRQQIEQANRALLESERLATIGRMASSVSHDLRHYLASVYANAEFLSSTNLTSEERTELFEDIKLAVDGTTELIESLLIFSRTGESVVRTQVSLSALLDRAVTLLRRHPSAEHVELAVQYDSASSYYALVDGKQVERALYNLLLNACQACSTMEHKRVTASLSFSNGMFHVTVTDSGAGVPPSVRESLFQPFVSEGKQNGTGLGLTLADCVAREHGGSVTLLKSEPGETVFLFTLAQHGETLDHVPQADAAMETRA